jgi:hypothetical protein
MRPSSVSSPQQPLPSVHAQTRWTSEDTSSRRSARSASATTVVISCSSATPFICAGESPVLSRTTSAPSLAVASIVSIGPRWLRQSTATREPGPTRRSASARASRSVRSWISRNVTVPRSSMIATRSGWRQRETTYAVVGVKP